MKKNEIIELKITDTTLDGSGVGKYDGIAVFVPGAVTGDVINAHILKVKSNLAFAKVKNIVTPSNIRTDELCRTAAKCGGCSLRHIKYTAELDLKEKTVKNNLKRIGKQEPEFEKITFGNPDRYRNKCQYPVAKNGDDLIIGFYSGHSHRVVDCPECLLQPKEFSTAVELFKEYLRNYSVPVYSEKTNSGLVRHLYMRKAESTGELMVCIVINGKELPHEEELTKVFVRKFGNSLKSVVLNMNTKKTNVILGGKCRIIYGNEYITDVLCGVKVRISPLSFYQVNRNVAELLYKKATEYAEPDDKTIIDLYCGAGTIGLSMAKRAKTVIGIEVVPEAVKDAEFNAKANGFTNCRFICGDASEAAEELKDEGIRPDTVIVDPPRKGCDAALIETIAKGFCPERVVYVSCDSATLARDTAIFADYGYKTVKAAPFDMFPRTAHVETVVLMSRVEGK